MEEEYTPIEKLRIITNWMNFQNESFNSRFKSISDIEKAYDYCDKNSLEFLDDLWEYLPKDEAIKVEKDITKLLGYNIF